MLFLGGAAYGGWWYYSAPARTYDEALAAITDIQNASYRIVVVLEAAGNNNKVTEEQQMLFPRLIERSASVLAGLLGKSAVLVSSMPVVIPGFETWRAELRARGAYALTENAIPDYSALFDISLGAHEESYSFGFEVRHVADTFYTRLVELSLDFYAPLKQLGPIGSLDVTEILKRWYSIKDEKIEEILRVVPGFEDGLQMYAERRRKIRELQSEYLPKMYTAALENRNDTILTGERAYQFTLTPHPDVLREYVREYMRMAQDRNFTRREEKEYGAFIDALSKSAIHVWIDGSAQVRRLRMDIPALDISGYQIRMVLESDLDDINTASVQAPSGSTPLDEVLTSLLPAVSASPSLSLDVVWKRSLAHVRTRAEIYHDLEGSYQGMCEDALIVKLIEEAEKVLSDRPSAVCRVNASGTAYHVFVSLSDAETYCVDSKGFAGNVLFVNFDNGSGGPPPGFYCDNTPFK